MKTVSLFTAEEGENTLNNDTRKRGARGRMAKILFIDDDPAILKIAEEIFPLLGHEVCIQPSGEDALAAFRASPDDFDVVVTDQIMPGMPGDRLASALLHLRPNLPILLCTGAHDQEFLEHLRTIGVRGCLTKPYIFSELDQQIRQMTS